MASNDQLSATGIESTLEEHRVFAPPATPHAGTPTWHVASMESYTKLHSESINDPETFYGRVAKELHWFSPWSKVLDWKAPDAKWFVGGKTNLCYNCVDRHVEDGHGDDIALVWEGEPADEDKGKPKICAFTYAQLQRRVAKFAGGLESLGVRKGEVVTIYMGMVPELAVAVLACARIGAPHSVIFGGFSSQAIVDRVLDADSRVIITCDGAWRRGKIVPLKESVDAACETLENDHDHRVDQVVMFKRIGVDPMPWNDERDVYFRDVEEMGDQETPCEQLDSEDMLFLLYTSGSTGKPKGIVHTTGGYMVHTYLTSKYVFNLIPDLEEPSRGEDSFAGQLFWCTADIGWITGHSYIVYGIMTNRVPTLMYEGAPNFPDEGRFWDIVDRHKVTQFYTAPTAIRAFMKWGDEHPNKYDLSSLQVLGTVGEPINPEAWMWYRSVIGKDRCPIVDTWWQTETGGHMLTPLPGVTPTKPGSCTLPFFGVDAAILDEKGNELPRNAGGLLAIRKPWPSMLRGIHGDRDRYIDTYWSKFDVDGAKISPYYFPGDGARQDADGNFWIMGRVDDVINVSGHRLGTMEVESALVSHDAVVEAAVVGMPHEIKGTGIAAFCTLAPNHAPADSAAAEKLKADLAAHVAKEIGAIAKPDQIRFTDALPKTRSGKIMRRLLRSIAEGQTEIAQDTTTLEDYSVLAKLRESDEG
ncbi:MAG: acetate--CoA ligase [Phycisphaeraceae bacterium]|nr:acetate--CoA ligase [Phycisphaerales bacterium]MCB9860069.1 acetate--CoA ligase [Phycisphaeraceae bacterium]